MGLPGAGKGTQGELLAKELKVPHISTGAMFRAAIRSNGPIGTAVRSYIERGQLVPDELSIEIVKERLSQSDCEPGFILDGFPRTVPQAIALDRTLPSLGMAVDAAINIQISESEAVRRIAERVVCSQCGATYNRSIHALSGSGQCRECGGPLVQRPDDTVETAKSRLVVYMEETHPVIDYYAAQEKLLSVDGQRSIGEVFEAIMSGLRRMRYARHSGEEAR